MIDMTQKKLREAHFFGQLLRKASRQPIRNGSEEFEYYLSAFLSAARAVTFALQYEEKAKYDAWYPAWLQARGDADRKLMKEMITHRNFAQKRGAPEAEQEWEYIPVSEIETGNREHPAYGFHWFVPPGTPPPTVGVTVYSFKESGDEVTAACQRYLEVLDQLVREFIGTHKLGQSGPPASQAFSSING